MSETSTPGQMCYEAFWLALMNTHPAGSERWHVLEARLREAWEAAAQAVLAAGPPLEGGLDSQVAREFGLWDVFGAEPCPWCGEPDCERSCTSAIPGSSPGQALADEEDTP